MMRYPFHEGEAAIPEGFLPAPVNLLTVPRPGGDLEITLVRIEAAATTLEAAVDAHHERVRRELPRFECLHRRAVQVDGRATIERALRFVTATGATYQRLAATLLGDGRLLLLGVAGRPGQEPDTDALFDHVMGSARWTEGA